MRAEDRAERRHELDLRRRPRLTHHRSQSLSPLQRVGVGNANAQRGRVARTRLEGRRELEERLAVPAHAFHRDDLPVLDREDRLDVEELAGPAARATDSAPANEVLERVDREQQPGVAPVAGGEHVDLVVRRPPLEPPLDRQAEHRDRR